MLRNLLHDTVNRLNEYFAINWRVLPFQPILSLFIFIAALIISIDSENAPLWKNDLIFVMWVGLSLACPPALLVSYILIKKYPGRPRYFGIWLRFAADIGQLAAVSAFWVVLVSSKPEAAIDLSPETATEFYALKIWLAILVFMVFLVVRDAWKIILTERIANKLEKAKKDGRE